MGSYRPNLAHARSDARALPRTQQQFLREMGIGSFFARGEEILELPQVDWKGRPLLTLRCGADFGCGPHDVNVPEYLCWALISLQRFRCAYH